MARPLRTISRTNNIAQRHRIRRRGCRHITHPLFWNAIRILRSRRGADSLRNHILPLEAEKYLCHRYSRIQLHRLGGTISTERQGEVPKMQDISFEEQFKASDLPICADCLQRLKEWAEGSAGQHQNAERWNEIKALLLNCCSSEKTHLRVHLDRAA